MVIQKVTKRQVAQTMIACSVCLIHFKVNDEMAVFKGFNFTERIHIKCLKTEITKFKKGAYPYGNV